MWSHHSHRLHWLAWMWSCHSHQRVAPSHDTAKRQRSQWPRSWRRLHHQVHRLTELRQPVADATRGVAVHADSWRSTAAKEAAPKWDYVLLLSPPSPHIPGATHSHHLETPPNMMTSAPKAQHHQGGEHSIALTERVTHWRRSCSTIHRRSSTDSHPQPRR